MAWIGAAIGAVGSYLASDNQASATQSAANTSAAAANQAAQTQQNIYNQQRADQAPWRQFGVNALNQLAGGDASTNGLADAYTKPFAMYDFQADPGYQFRLNEGLKSLQQSAAARGGLLSGNALKGITRYSQDYASNEFQNAYNRYVTNQTNAFNRLASIAGIGQTANNALGQAGQNYANQTGGIAMNNAANMGNAALAAGQARASMYQGIGNALGRVNWGGMGSSNGYGADGYGVANQYAPYQYGDYQYGV